MVDRMKIMVSACLAGEDCKYNGRNNRNDRVLCAGGLLDEEGKMKGSVLVMDFESGSDLDEYLSTEPMNVVIVNGEKAGK